MKEVTAMGLDLTISVQSNFGIDEQGRNTYKVTQLANLRNCYAILDQLSNRLDGGFANCATYTFYGETFHEILEGLQSEIEDLAEGITPEYKEQARAELDYNIKKLKEFIETNNVHNDDTQDYQVHAWW